MTQEEITTAKKLIHAEAKDQTAKLNAMQPEEAKAKFGSFDGWLAAKEQIITDARNKIKNLVSA